MNHSRFLRNVLLKGLLLFIIFNLAWALIPHAGLGSASLYNSLLRGRERFPFGEDPSDSYNLSLYDLNAMFASHKLTAGSKPADEYRVFILGDSATWGTLLRPEETLAGLLDAADLRSADGRVVRFYNLGYPTLSLVKDVMILDEAMAYQPDLILWRVTLQSFPRDRQLESPIVANNLERVRDLTQRYGLALDVPADSPTLWQRTIAGERRALADLIRLQFYGVMWSATGIDQAYPTDYVPAARDLEADPSFNGWTESFPKDALAFDVLAAGGEIAGEVPVVLINEPILISHGANSDLRYNFYYPRWAFDSYKYALLDAALEQGWEYLEAWDLIPSERFTNSAIHLDPSGEGFFASSVEEWLRLDWLPTH